ncbi:mannose-binding protein [Streptomyces sp. NPDC060064]|uniref:mannose-binding protein n=1 Tax=Streptomyces sp. NPDC060064 TaxID=3347049 RepID=UPI003699B0CD
MSPQHHTPGANAEAAAARAEEAGSPPPSSAPDEQAPSPAAAPKAESGTAPSGETATAAAPPPAAAKPAEEPEEGVAVAAAVGTAPPDVKAATGTDTGRPRKPILAGAAIAGAVLVAIPLLLAGSANDERPDSAKGLAADSDTVLNASSAPAVLDDYVAEKPSSSPSKAKPKKSEAPKVAVQPAAPSPSPKASSSPEKKPKATPKPNWGTKTVYATSVLQVGQAWSTNRIRMVMQSDGNLVVYNEKGKPIWAAMTFGANHRAIFQQDGNLVIHNADDRPIWASKSHGHENAQLVLRADGKVVILHNGGVIWST